MAGVATVDPFGLGGKDHIDAEPLSKRSNEEIQGARYENNMMAGPTMLIHPCKPHRREPGTKNLPAEPIRQRFDIARSLSPQV